MSYVKFLKSVTQYELLKGVDHLLIGVSGGIDSMVLLGMLARYANSSKLKITVAHVNYGLRGRASIADEKLVRMRAAELGFDFAVLSKKVSSGENLQDSARRIRYDFFRKLALERKIDAIATAHHIEDQAETVLLHLIRGSGLRGLCGMKPMMVIDGLKYIRPMLNCTRDEIVAYAKRSGIKYRTDSSNSKMKYRRNAIRHKLLPILEGFNPKISEVISEMSARLTVDDNFMDQEAASSAATAITHECASELIIDRAIYIKLHRAIRTRILRIAYEKIKGTAQDLNSDQLEKIDKIAMNDFPKGTYRLKSPLIFERSGDEMKLYLQKAPCRHR